MLLSFLDNQQWINERPLLFYIFNKIAHFQLRKDNRLRVVNKEEKQKYIEILGLDANKIDVAPVPINMAFWQDEPTKGDKNNFLKKYNIDTSKPILSWAGRAVKVKNLPYLFKSVSKVNEKIGVNFLIAGDMKKPYLSLEGLAKKYKVQPIYLGLLNHNDLKIMYYLTNLYLHTSNYEGFGLVVSDAQACGTVVVSRDTAGTSDIIDNTKSGYLIGGYENEFSDKLLMLLENKNKLINMETYTKNTIKTKFDENKMFKDIFDSIKNSVV